MHTLAEDDVLIRKGAAGDALYIICDGRLKVVALGYRDRELVLNEFGPGQIVGETSLVDRAPRSSSVVAVTPTHVLVIKHNVFLAVIKQSPELAENFIGAVNERMRFSSLYIQKVIEWSQAIAEGDYQAVQRQIEAIRAADNDMSETIEDRIGVFLSAFFKMIEGVKQREDFMKKQLEQQFEIQIDTSKKDQEVENLAKRTFFYRVKTMADQMRTRRKEREEQNDSSETE